MGGYQSGGYLILLMLLFVSHQRPINLMKKDYKSSMAYNSRAGTTLKVLLISNLMKLIL
jgi:hypothetical protein